MNFPDNKGRAPELVAMLNSQNPREVEITVDSYPYLAGSTYLASFLPEWVATRGNEGVLEALRDDEQSARIRYDLEVEGTSGNHGFPMDWNTIGISGVATEKNQQWVGKTITEIARILEIEPYAAARRLLLEERLQVNILLYVGHEENVQTIMAQPYHMAGSDGILAGSKPHPRGWGTFARYLGHYTRELGLFTWQEIVRKMASMPCRRLGQWDRGVIRAGMWADVVVFDPDTVGDRETYDDPRRYPVGIPYVMVNGVLVKDDDHHTGERPGRAVRLAVTA